MVQILNLQLKQHTVLMIKTSIGSIITNYTKIGVEKGQDGLQGTL